MGETLGLVVMCALFLVLTLALMTARDIVLWVGRKLGWEIIALRIPTESAQLFLPSDSHGPRIAIGPVTWAHLQRQAKARLAEKGPVHPDVRNYWLGIAAGKVPPHLFLFDPNAWKEPAR